MGKFEEKFEKDLKTIGYDGESNMVEIVNFLIDKFKIAPTPKYTNGRWAADVTDISEKDPKIATGVARYKTFNEALEGSLKFCLEFANLKLKQR
jgi:hypothetical protein